MMITYLASSCPQTATHLCSVLPNRLSVSYRLGEEPKLAKCPSPHETRKTWMLRSPMSTRTVLQKLPRFRASEPLPSSPRPAWRFTSSFSRWLDAIWVDSSGEASSTYKHKGIEVVLILSMGFLSCHQNSTMYPLPRPPLSRRVWRVGRLAI